VRKLCAGVAACLLVAVPAAAEVYRVTVTRIDYNLYRDVGSKAIIETRFCHERVNRDDAVLKWEGRYGDNWIVFSDGSKCDVVAVR
jgi:hypothetical protein